MSKRVVVAGLLALLGVLGCVGLTAWLALPPAEPGRDCFEKLKVGMPEKEADAILTKGGFTNIWSGIDDKLAMEVMRYTLDGSGNPAIVVVYPLKDRRIVEKDYIFRPEPTFLDILQKRLFGH